MTEEKNLENAWKEQEAACRREGIEVVDSLLNEDGWYEDIDVEIEDDRQFWRAKARDENFDLDCWESFEIGKWVWCWELFYNGRNLPEDEQPWAAGKCRSREAAFRAVEAIHRAEHDRLKKLGLLEV